MHRFILLTGSLLVGHFAHCTGSSCSQFHPAQVHPAHRFILLIGSSCTQVHPAHRSILNTGSFCSQINFARRFTTCRFILHNAQVHPAHRFTTRRSLCTLHRFILLTVSSCTGSSCTQVYPAHRFILHTGSSCSQINPEHRFILLTDQFCTQVDYL